MRHRARLPEASTQPPRRGRNQPKGTMSTLIRILLVALLVIVLGGVIFLVTWDIPPPTTTIERPIPDERLPR